MTTIEVKSGFVAGVFLPPAEIPSVLLVPNTKTHTAVWGHYDAMAAKIPAHIGPTERPYPFNVAPEKIADMRLQRRIPHFLWKWYQYERRRLNLPDTKPDALGLPGGLLEQWDFDEAAKNGEPENYADYGFGREFVEESGLVVFREEKNLIGPSGKPLRRPLFERIVTLYEDDRADRNNDHEDHFFWAKEADGVLNTEGVVGETLAPEIIPISSLTPQIFYRKHAEALGITLSYLIKEYGMNEYKESLMHLHKFPKSGKLRREPKERKPDLAGVSDEEAWARWTGQQKGLEEYKRDNNA